MSTATRINEIREHIGNAYDSLDDLGIDLSSTDKNIDNIASKIEEIYNSFPKVTGTGENVTLENTKYARMETEIGGNSEQETTSISEGDEYDSPSPDYPQKIKSVGDNVNLFDVVSATANQNQYILNNDKTVTISRTWGMDGRVWFQPITLKAGTYTLSFIPNLDGTLLNLRVSVQNKITLENIINKVVTITNNIKLAQTFTLEDTSTITICIMPNGTTSGTLTLENIKLEQGTIETPYSEYGQGNANVTVCNKNLGQVEFDKYLKPTGSGNNKTIISSSYKTAEIIKVKPSTSYTITGDFSDLGDKTMRVLFFDKYPNIDVVSTNFKYSSSELTITTTTSTQYIMLYNTFSRNTVVNNLMVVEGTTAPTEYIEHQSQTFTIPTQQPFRKTGDYKDTFVKQNGKWYEKHMPYIESYNNETLPQDVYTEDGGIKYCNNKSMSTTGQFSLGASVQYVDEENWTYIECTQVQSDILDQLYKAKSYNGVTYVFSEDEVSPIFECSALKQN